MNPRVSTDTTCVMPLPANCLASPHTGTNATRKQNQTNRTWQSHKSQWIGDVPTHVRPRPL